MDKILKTWPKDVRIVLHNRPLSFHKRALPAALAAMAAGEQGKFWPYHDLLWERKKFEDPDLEKMAVDLGLDIAKWKADKDSAKMKAFVDKQDKACAAAGSSGTPGFFVNGRYMSGALPFEDFKPIIEEELKKAQEMVKKGTPRNQVYTEILKQAGKSPGGGEKPPLDKVARQINTDGAPGMGPENAVATLVVYSDFQ